MSRSGLVLAGYFGFGNTGDEAVLTGFLDGLRALDAGVPVSVLTREPDSVLPHPAVTAVNRNDLRQVWRVLRRHRALVFGGGSLLQDVTSRRSSMWYIGLSMLARRAGCAVGWFGQGVGPLQHGDIRALCALELVRAACVVTRDAVSASMLSGMGCRQVITAGDTALLMHTEPCGVAQRVDVLAAPRVSAEVGYAQLAVMGRALRRVADVHGLGITLAPLHPSEDGEAVASVARECGDCRVLDTPVTPQNYLMHASEAVAVLGVRLHALVLGALCGAPGVAVSYDPKVKAFWGPMQPDMCTAPDELDEAHLEALLNETISTRDTRSEVITRRITEQRQQTQQALSRLLRAVGCG